MGVGVGGGVKKEKRKTRNFELDINSKVTPKNTQVAKSSLPPFQNKGKGLNVITSGFFFSLQTPLSSAANRISIQPVYSVPTAV